MRPARVHPQPRARRRDGAFRAAPRGFALSFLLVATMLAGALPLASDNAEADHPTPPYGAVLTLEVRVSPRAPSPPDPAFPESGKVKISFVLHNNAGESLCARVKATLADPKGNSVEVLDKRSGLIAHSDSHTIAEYTLKIPEGTQGAYTLTSDLVSMLPVAKTSVFSTIPEKVCRDNGGVQGHSVSTKTISVTPMAGRSDFEVLRGNYYRWYNHYSRYDSYGFEAWFHSPGAYPAVEVQFSAPAYGLSKTKTISVAAGENRVWFEEAHMSPVEAEKWMADGRLTIDPEAKIPELREDNNQLLVRASWTEPFVRNLRTEPAEPKVGQPAQAFVDVHNPSKIAIKDVVPMVFKFEGKSTNIDVREIRPEETVTVGPFTFTPQKEAEKSVLSTAYDPWSHVVRHDLSRAKAERVLRVPVGVDGRIEGVRFEPAFPALGVDATAVLRIANNGEGLAPAGTARVLRSDTHQSTETAVPPIPGGASTEVRVPIRGWAAADGRIEPFSFIYDVEGEHDRVDNYEKASPWNVPAWDLRPRVVSPSRILEHEGRIAFEFEVRNEGAGGSPAGTLFEVAPLDAGGKAIAERAVRVGIPAIAPGGSDRLRVEVETKPFERVAFRSPGDVDRRVAGGSIAPFGTFRDAELRVAYSPPAPSPGDLLVVTLTVANVGDAVLPPGIPVRAYWQDWQFTEFATTVALQPGEVETFRVARAVPADGKMGFMANIHPDFAEGGRGNSNNDASFGQAGERPHLRLQVERSASDGRLVAVVTNEGPDATSGSTVRAKVPGSEASPEVAIPAVRRGATVRVPIDFPPAHGAGDARFVLTPREPVAPSSVLETTSPVGAVDATRLTWVIARRQTECLVLVNSQSSLPTGPIPAVIRVDSQPPVTSILPSIEAHGKGTFALAAATVGQTCHATLGGVTQSYTLQPPPPPIKSETPAPGLEVLVLIAAVGLVLRGFGRRT